MLLFKKIQIIALFALLIAGAFSLSQAETMEVIPDRVQFSFISGGAPMLPGSSSDPNDAIADLRFQMKFINGIAPTGTLTQIDFYFYFDNTKWDYLYSEIEEDNWIGSVDCMTSGGCENGYIHLKLTGNGGTPSTGYKIFAHVYFTPLCQMSGDIGITSPITFDQTADNGVAVYDGGSSDWYTPGVYTNSFNMVSAYINNYYIDINDGSSGLMGDEVDVPVVYWMHINPYRLSSVTHKIDYDSDKLEFVEVIPDPAKFPNGTSGWTISSASSDPIEIYAVDPSDGIIDEPASTSVPDKLYDIVFRIKGSSGGPGSSIPVTFVTADCSQKSWTVYNEGSGTGCEALDNSMYYQYHDGDVDIPAYTAAMTIELDGDYINKYDQLVDFNVCMQNNFPAGKNVDASSGTGGIGTLFDMPAFFSLYNIVDNEPLDFSGQSYQNGIRLFYGEQQYHSGWANFIMSPNTCTEMYTVSFNFASSQYDPDYGNRYIQVPWRASGNNWSTFVTDTTGFATLNAADIDTTTIPAEVHMGRYRAPFTTSGDRYIHQPLYLAANFDIGKFSVDVSVTGQCVITSVTPAQNVSYQTLSSQAVRIYYDGIGMFHAATGDLEESIATINYRVNCTLPYKTGDSRPGEGEGYNVYGYVTLGNAFIKDVPENSHFVDLVYGNVRGYCPGFIEADPEPDLIIDYKSGVDLIPETFALLQNSPNPFNPRTVISYDVPVAAHVTITIINILGQEITTLVDEVKSPGHHVIEWDGRDQYGQMASSGIYLYNMRAGDYAETRKMMLMK